MEVDLSAQVASFTDFFTGTYKDKIDELRGRYPSRRSLYIDYKDLEKFDPEMADAVLREPDIMLEASEEAIRQLNFAVAAGQKFEPHVRVHNLPTEEALIEELGSKDINDLVGFKCVVTKRAEVMHRVKVATYKCQLCDSELKLFVGKDFTPPKRCEQCKKLSLVQMNDESTFTDIQRVEVQELLERVRGGAPAAHIELLLEDDLVNTIAPGDSIEVIGVLRLKPPMKSRQKQDLIYSRFIEVNSVTSLKRDFEEVEISKEDERRIKELSKRPDISDIVTRSIAPSIYGHLEVKKALALQLFGGTRGKRLSDDLPIRDDIHILLIGDPGIAKCVGGNSNVMLSDGAILNIRDIVEEVLSKNKKEDSEGYYGVSNHDLVSMDLDGRTADKKATVFWKLKAPDHLYRIETVSGRKVTVTPKHPFFVTEDALVMPKKASELNIGDFIATPHRIKIDGSLQRIPSVKHGKTNANALNLPKYLDEGFARFLGYLIGDGYIRRTSSYEMSLTNKEKVLLDDFAGIVGSYGLRTYVKKRERSSCISVFSVDLGESLERLGMVSTSFDKHVPVEVMRSPNRVLKEFIRAYFDCEASISNEGITVVSASERLLTEVQLLLLRFGILSQLHQTYSRAVNAKKHKKTRYHRLFICGANAKLYFSEIGFMNKKKARKQSLLPETSNTNLDVVPGLSRILRDIRLSLGMTQFDCGIPRSTYQHYERGDRNPSYDSLKKVVAAFKRRKNKKARVLLKLLEELSNSDIYWDKITKKRKITPKEDWVYDLQVDDAHNFISNGIMVHNSRFLQSVSEIAPKSIYVSGKSVSGAGLTVAAERDELGDGGWTLKAGALVLASGGCAQVDEFDKIAEEDRAALHEAMETQSISVAKAGIVAKFRTKTAILAAANPKYGRFDQTKNLSDQFDVPPTLLSRFDLIFPIVDVLDEEKDSKLAEHILLGHRGEKKEDKKETLERILLMKYIAYARRKVAPKLMPVASEKIKEFYVDLRRKSKDAGSVAITPRYLEGLVRLAEAHAKIRLSTTVEGDDAEVAISLFNYVMRQILTDRETGTFDVDIVTTGKPKSEREKMQRTDTIMEIIREHLRRSDTADVEEVIGEAKTYDIDKPVAEKIIKELLRRGVIYEKEYGQVRIVGE